DARLWQPSEPVVEPAAAEVRRTVDDLAATLGDFRLRQGFGRAIAAPQIGVQQRIILVNMNDGSFGPAPLINPRITRASDELMELWDDCFSFPNLLVRVRRHVSIEVEYDDLHGTRRSVDAREDLAELLQHEIDHLDGILATDRVVDSRGFTFRYPPTASQMV
ncbi:MAG: hypothetical protein RIR52_1109, partial [Acidobacteriota bacterium]